MVYRFGDGAFEPSAITRKGRLSLLVEHFLVDVDNVFG
jgi:hypothetical protein